MKRRNINRFTKRTQKYFIKKHLQKIKVIFTAGIYKTDDEFMIKYLNGHPMCKGYLRKHLIK